MLSIIHTYTYNGRNPTVRVQAQVLPLSHEKTKKTRWLCDVYVICDWYAKLKPTRRRALWSGFSIFAIYPLGSSCYPQPA